MLLVSVVACGHGDELRASTGPGNFTGGRDAAGALATISQRLIERGRQCGARHGPDAPECRTLGVASAWAQVAAVDVARCGRADAMAARRTMLQLLDSVDAASRGRLREPPSMPPVPNCR